MTSRSQPSPGSRPDERLVHLEVDGRSVSIPDDGSTLLDVLRERLGITSVKDGCSPQGQCGCCTVLVDGAPRVACVTPVRRVAGRHIETPDGLPAERAAAWGTALCSTGGSQCGFCTPGIVMRLEGLTRGRRGTSEDHGAVERALGAHLCRCTGWRTILEAWDLVAADAGVGAAEGARTAASGERDLAAAERRATIEGGVAQRVGSAVALGAGGFADDTCPDGALVAVPDGRGGWAMGETATEARAAAGHVQGRRTTVPPEAPLEVPDGEWCVELRTSWVEPAYLEPDASWCEPGGEPASSLGNGGAFGGKVTSPAAEVARRLADEHGRAVRVLLTREDVVRMGPKRPPVAIGVRSDGTGILRAVATEGLAGAVAPVAPGLVVEEVELAGPPTSIALRGAGWFEAAVAVAAATGSNRIASPGGGSAEAEVDGDGRITVHVSCGSVLDEVVVRSYCIGAAHQALSWVTSESIAVDEAGGPLDLTIRSFGVLRASAMPEVEIVIEDDGSDPVNGSDAVLAAVALAVWRHQGLSPAWPTGVALRP